MTIAIYLQKHYTPATARAYEREIAIYLSNYPKAQAANYKSITNYIGLLRSRYNNPATINRIVSSIKVYYDYLCSEAVRDDNPARAIRLRDKRTRDIQLQDLFTAAELEQLLSRKERYADLDQRNRVLSSLLIYQALHPREMAALKIADIALSEGSIYIKATPKTSGRTLQLKPHQILLFQEYVTQTRPKLLRDKQSNALLVGIRGGAMPAEYVTQHIKRSFTALYPGRKVNAQIVRQSVIANLLKEGHDISVVQAFAGHKYPSSTEKYRQGGIETLQAAVNKYHPFN